MSWHDAQKALEIELESFCANNGYNLVYENVTSELPTDFLDYSFVPATTRATALGLDACDRYSGIFQVGIYVPLNDDPTDSRDIEQKVIDNFSKGSVFTYNGQTVRVENRTPRTPIKDVQYYRRIVDIEYYADVH